MRNVFLGFCTLLLFPFTVQAKDGCFCPTAGYQNFALTKRCGGISVGAPACDQKGCEITIHQDWHRTLPDGEIEFFRAGDVVKLDCYFGSPDGQYSSGRAPRIYSSGDPLVSGD